MATQTYGNASSGGIANIPDWRKQGRRESTQLNQAQLGRLSARGRVPKHPVGDTLATLSACITTIWKLDFTLPFAQDLCRNYAHYRWRRKEKGVMATTLKMAAIFQISK